MTTQDKTFNPEAREKREKTPELKLAEYIWSQADQAIKMQTVDIEAGKEPLRFHEYLQKIWTGKVLGNDLGFYPPQDQFTGDFAAAKLQFHQGRNKDGFGAEARTKTGNSDFMMNIQTGGINYARGSERSEAIRQMKMVIFHEVQHFYKDGSDPDVYTQDLNSIVYKPEDDKEKELKSLFEKKQKEHADDKEFLEHVGFILYLCHPAEVNSYACQFASVYAQDFPNQAFNLVKFEETIKKSIKSGVIAKHYVDSFADPKRQDKYDAFVQRYHKGATLADVRNRFIAQITDFVEQLREA